MVVSGSPLADSLQLRLSHVKLSASASGQAIVAVDFALQTRRIAAA
jgi:hypothetical protein